jgi:hypothetical protein
MSHARRWVAAYSVLIVTCASAAHGGFVNGVETFDGTVPDTATWVASTNANIAQNDALSLHLRGTYTAHNFTLGVGQGVRARMAMRPWTGGFEQSFLLLSTRSAGMDSTALFNDSRYVGFQAEWDESFNRTIFRGTDGTTGTHSAAYINQLAGNHTGEWFSVEVNRVSQSVFQFSIWDAVGSPIGSLTRGVTTPISGGTSHGPVPAQLYLTLNSFATWDDVTILPEPSAAATLLLLGGGLAIARRGRPPRC